MEPPDQALIDLRDERDDLKIRLSLRSDDRLATTAELLRLKKELAILERRIADYAKATDATP